MVAVQTRRFTVSEYHRMSELGILVPTERTELVNGQIIAMAAKGTLHTSAVLLTQDLLSDRLGKRVFVKSQDPIRLNDDSEPEPDIVLAVRDPLAYSDHHPTAAEVLLVIEIADSSLKYDLETKAPLYAKAGISEYWVLDVVERKLHVFRQPGELEYQRQTILAETLEIAPLAFPDCAIAIRDLLPPTPVKDSI
ncbi:MAG: Uma2 family endonuclease [Aphanocapsa sp. GSE-SYN-MK-11-07L]|jgi:Uma2 family endonuclease|nr:Uma2 family endonuclease [Aphanocapsa sp. GSE-SYN-MK-11-07L]